MKYIKANSILPISLIEELQNYIQGGYIYVPSKGKNKKSWGELSGYKREIEKRNEAPAATTKPSFPSFRQCSFHGSFLLFSIVTQQIDAKKAPALYEMEQGLHFLSGNRGRIKDT